MQQPGDDTFFRPKNAANPLRWFGEKTCHLRHLQNSFFQLNQYDKLK